VPVEWRTTGNHGHWRTKPAPITCANAGHRGARRQRAIHAGTVRQRADIRGLPTQVPDAGFLTRPSCGNARRPAARRCCPVTILYGQPRRSRRGAPPLGPARLLAVPQLRALGDGLCPISAQISPPLRHRSCSAPPCPPMSKTLNYMAGIIRRHLASPGSCWRSRTRQSRRSWSWPTCGKARHSRPPLHRRDQVGQADVPAHCPRLPRAASPGRPRRLRLADDPPAQNQPPRPQRCP
jgi:hypothetical protein